MLTCTTKPATISLSEPPGRPPTPAGALRRRPSTPLSPPPVAPQPKADGGCAHRQTKSGCRHGPRAARSPAAKLPQRAKTAQIGRCISSGKNAAPFIRGF
jgi:hypothetical protein